MSLDKSRMSSLHDKHLAAEAELATKEALPDTEAVKVEKDLSENDK